MAEGDASASEQIQERMRKLVSQWSQGQASLKQIVGLSEQELYAIANQGYLLFMQGKTESARVVFEGLVAVDPRNAYYYRALGAVYWRLKEPQKAVKQFTYAIRVAPKETSSYVNRAEVYIAQRQFDAARKDLDYAMRNAGPFEGALVRKARAMLSMLPQK